MWIGYWKDILLDDVICVKCDFDCMFYIYCYLFDDDVYDVYYMFIYVLFEMYMGFGCDVWICLLIQVFDGDCSVYGLY